MNLPSPQLPDRWTLRPIRLKYRLGELTLFRKTFRLKVNAAHFTEIAGPLSEEMSPPDALDRSVAGVLVRSCPVEGTLRRLRYGPGALRYVPQQYRRFFTRIQGSFEDYLKAFSSKSRSTLKRKLKKFAERSGGELRWREFRQPEDIAEYHREAVAVSKRTYQDRLLGAGLPDTPEFVAKLRDDAANGRVRGYLLYADAAGTKAVAYLHLPIVGDGIAIYEYLGYDPEVAALSAGTVLQYVVFEHLFGEAKLRLFDFTEGEGPHKEFWANGSTPCGDVYWFRRTPLTLAFVLLHAGLDSASTWLGRALDRLGLKQRIKRFLRRGGTAAPDATKTAAGSEGAAAEPPAGEANPV